MGIGDFVTGLFGSKNKERAKGYEVDSNAYQYGGRPGGAAEDAARYRGRSDEYNATMGNATRDAGAMYQNAGQARDQQGAVAGMMMQRAQGKVPSIAQMQADRQMQQATASQASAAASAQGPAALALAQQNAASNTANAQQNISGQAQVNAANERLQAEQSAFGAYSGMRAGDFQGAQQQQQFAMGLGQLGLGYTQAEMGVNQAQLSAQQNEQAQRSANALGAQGINAGVGGQNAATNQQNAMGAIGAITSAAGKLADMPSDERGKVVFSPADFVKSTWGSSRPSDQQQAAAQGALSTASMPSPQFQDRTLEDRQNNAGGGFMLGKQLGTAVYGGRADGSLPSSVAAGMKSSGVQQKAEGKKDAKAQGDAKASQEKAKTSLASVLDDAGERGAKMAASVDTRYHAGGGYVPPQLLSVTSDINAKMPASMPQPAAVMSPSAYALSGGGMDVGATAQLMSNQVAGDYRANPTAGVAGGGAATAPVMSSDMMGKAPVMPSDMLGKMPSDERAKSFQPTGALGLDDPNLRIGDDGRGYIAEEQKHDPLKASFVSKSKPGGMSPGDVAGSMAKAKARPAAAKRDDLDARIREMMASFQAQKEAQLGNGPAVRPDGSTMLSDERTKTLAKPTGDRPGNAAARSLASVPYAYRPGMTPPEQAPGEVNYGPMAQNMASDPVARTAIVKQPNGMLGIDIPKYTKVLGAVAADNQQQDDEQDKKIAHLARVLTRRK